MYSGQITLKKSIRSLTLNTRIKQFQILDYFEAG